MCICVYLYVCLYMPMCACVYVCACMYVCICMYVCMYLCMCTTCKPGVHRGQNRALDLLEPDLRTVVNQDVGAGKQA